MTQPSIVMITGSHGARTPHSAGTYLPLEGETLDHAAFADALRAHNGPVTVRTAPTGQDAGEIILTVPEQLAAVLALTERQAARTVAFDVGRPEAPRLARDLSLAAVIDAAQYRNWLLSHGRPHRARFYGLPKIAARMQANTIPAPGTSDYVLLDKPAYRDLPALIAAYLKELAAEDDHSG